MTTRDQIAQQALKLSPEDREYIADLLERSLPAEELWSEEIANDWSREIDRRIGAYDRGETTAIDFDIALENMRRGLETHRANKAAQ